MKEFLRDVLYFLLSLVLLAVWFVTAYGGFFLGFACRGGRAPDCGPMWVGWALCAVVFVISMWWLIFKSRGPRGS